MLALSVAFAVGLVLGFVLSLVSLYYLGANQPQSKPTPEGSAPFVRRNKARKKPVVIDEFRELLKEQEQMKEQRR